jgi:simple sugar transport system permease protein
MWHKSGGGEAAVMSLVAEDEDTIQRHFSYEWASGAIIPVMAVVLALIIGALIVRISGSDPWNAYSQLFNGAFGSAYNISETLVAAIPLILAGLSVAFAFRAGLFNIGAQGQILIAALLSAWVGYSLNLPGVILIPLALIAGVLGGATAAGLAGLLKAWRGAHEVITTIMMNYIALYLSQYLLESTPLGTPGPMQQHAQPGFPGTPPMNASLPVIVPNSWVANGRLHAGLIIALVAALLFWFVLWRTTLGYKLRAVGLNPKAAAYGGVNVGWNIVLAMLIAGAFAGLAAVVSLFGTEYRSLTDSFLPTAGFDAIAVALLGRNTAPGVILGAILFGAFEHGGALMQSSAGISSHLIEILQGLIIFFIGADALVRYLARHGVIHLPRLQRKEAVA